MKERTSKRFLFLGLAPLIKPHDESQDSPDRRSHHVSVRDKVTDPSSLLMSKEAVAGWVRCQP